MSLWYRKAQQPEVYGHGMLLCVAWLQWGWRRVRKPDQEPDPAGAPRAERSRDHRLQRLLEAHAQALAESGQLIITVLHGGAREAAEEQELGGTAEAYDAARGLRPLAPLLTDASGDAACGCLR